MIYFYNDTEAPLTALFTLGISAKTQNAIGYFGTGFKYGLATFLRTGHRVWLNDVEFTTREESVRNQTFSVIQYGDRDLGFTTDFGKKWEPWMAFREFYANALDENGGATNQPVEAKTVIRVSGPNIDDLYFDRDKIFLKTAPLFQSNSIAIHPNPSVNLYYRGMLAGPAPLPTLFTYNYLDASNLSENRTLRSDYSVMVGAATLLLHEGTEEVLERVLLASELNFESRFSFTYGTPSETFLHVVNNNRKNARLNKSALDLFIKHNKITENELEYEEVCLSASDRQSLGSAWRILKTLGVEPFTFTVVDSLGHDIYAMCRNSRIYIAYRTFDRGPRFIASTLFEEWIHSTLGYRDMTRDLQDYLFDRLIAIADKGQF